VTLRAERVVFDTNVWIFGLRKHPDRPACYALLERIGEFHLLLPWQILRELQANLIEEELRTLFRLIHLFPESVEIRRSKPGSGLIRKYQELGCKVSDAIIAAQLEEEGIRTLITEKSRFSSRNSSSSLPSVECQ
jgi:predicted nucleic acid-binding protein